LPRLPAPPILAGHGAGRGRARRAIAARARSRPRAPRPARLADSGRALRPESLAEAPRRDSPEHLGRRGDHDLRRPAADRRPPRAGERRDSAGLLSADQPVDAALRCVGAGREVALGAAELALRGADLPLRLPFHRPAGRARRRAPVQRLDDPLLLCAGGALLCAGEPPLPGVLLLLRPAARRAVWRPGSALDAAQRGSRLHALRRRVGDRRSARRGLAPPAAEPALPASSSCSRRGSTSSTGTGRCRGATGSHGPI